MAFGVTRFVLDVELFVNRYKTTTSPATAKRVFAIVNHMLNFAERMDLTPRNPVKRGVIKFPRCEGRVRRLLPEEEGSLWTVLTQMERQPGDPGEAMLKAPTTLALDTGLRKGTLLRLPLGMLLPEKGQHGAWDCPAEIMKGKRRSLKFLTSRARTAIETRRRYYERLGCVRPSMFMFGKLDGTGYWEGESAGIERAWQKAKALADLKEQDLRFHDLRAEFGSRLSDARVPLRNIQRALGHASITMTREYLRQGEGEAEEVAGVLESLVTSGKTDHSGATPGATVVPFRQETRRIS